MVVACISAGLLSPALIEISQIIAVRQFSSLEIPREVDSSVEVSAQRRQLSTITVSRRMCPVRISGRAETLDDEHLAGVQLWIAPERVVLEAPKQIRRQHRIPSG